MTRQILILTFLCAFAWAAPTAVAQQSSPTRLIKADTVITMNGEPLSPGAVLIQDGKIREVGSSLQAAEDVPVIDLGEGSVLMPGLVDPYSQTALSAAGTDEITSEVTLDFRAADSIDWWKSERKQQRLAGTTTMCLCPGRENVFAGIAAIVKTGADQTAIINDDGALVLNLCSDPTSRNRSRSRPDGLYIRQPNTRMGVVWVARKTFDKAQRSEDTQRWEPIKEVLEKQRPLMVFSRMSYDLQTVANLQDEFGYEPIVVGAQEGYKVKEMLAERKYPVILEPIATGSERGQERSELCWNNAGVLVDAGVPVALSGDNLLEQARFAVRHGLDSDLALKAITTVPAGLLGIEDRVGKIAVGFDADLVALTGAPLEFTTSIRWVMVDGDQFMVEEE